jgi:hypothetical protein
VRVAGVQIEGQQFGLATNSSDIIMATNPNSDQHVPTANGILGLGFPSLTNAANGGGTTYNPFVFSLVEQGHIDQPVFSIQMGAMSDKGWAGEIVLGGVHPDYKDELHYVPLLAANKQEYTYWMVPGQGVRLSHPNGQTLQHFPQTPPKGFIIDTGTTLTYMDKDLAEQIVSSAAGDHAVLMDQTTGTYIVDCSMYNTDQRIELEFAKENGPVRLIVPIRDLVIPLNADHPQRATQCMFGIAPWIKAHANNKTLERNGLQMMLIGDSILRSTYLVFDMEKRQIGFAPVKQRKDTFVIGPTTHRMAVEASQGIVNDPMSNMVKCIFVVSAIMFWM